MALISCRSDPTPSNHRRRSARAMLVHGRCLARRRTTIPISVLARRSLVGFGARDLLAPVIAARADVVAQMHFTADRLDGERRLGEEVMGTVHAALGRRLLVLLNCHHALLRIVFGTSGRTHHALVQAPSGCRGANGNASSSSSSTSVNGSIGAAASTTSALLSASSAASSRSSCARSTSVR